MRLFFMRHAQAVEKDEWKGEEEHRPLSAEGERDTKRAAERLARIGFHVALILSSPLARARRTAEIVGEALKPPAQPVLDDRLAPGFGNDALDDILEERDGLESILFVGHEPDLGLIVGDIVSCARVELKKGALALVDFDRESGAARLLWLVPQSVLM